MKSRQLSPARIAAIKARYDQCKATILSIGWITQGSVSENHPGTWRWTRKVKAKTVTVALSADQTVSFRQAVSTHRQLEKQIATMRVLSQEILLHSIKGPHRRNPQKSS